MILQLTKTEYVVMETLIGDGFDDGEVLSQMVEIFGVQTRLINDRRRKAQMIRECVAA
jgi:hypothetical protein